VSITNPKPLAFITGASSGIGAAFARRLAADGYDLIIHGRRKELLDALAAELAQKHGTRCEVLIAELSEDAGIELVAQRVASAVPDLLINNAGIGAGGKFADPDLAPKMAMLHLHIDATVRITHAALPAMRRRGSGAIISVASVAGLAPSGGSVLYSASKAFLVFFSESLALDLLGSGIRVQALCPGLTHTDFHSRIGLDYSRLPESMWQSADTVVAESLRCLARGRTLCITGRINRLMVWLYRHLPLSWYTALMRMGTRKYKI
jgi:short-subunit dehydrogenase